MKILKLFYVVHSEPITNQIQINLSRMHGWVYPKAETVSSLLPPPGDQYLYLNNFFTKHNITSGQFLKMDTILFMALYW